MKETDFAYWLQGFFEIGKPETITPEQVSIIRNHINLVKKCWEPRIAQPKKEEPTKSEDIGMDLLPDDLNIAACTEDLPEIILEDEDTNLFHSTDASGDTLFRC